MKNYDTYLTAQAVNTQKVIKWAKKRLEKSGHEFDDLLTMDKPQLEDVITKTIPNSKKSITTLCYILGAYNRWLLEHRLVDNLNLYNVSQSIDKDQLWNKVKKYAPKKFISHETYEEVVHGINVYEEHNALYYSTIFQCIYEGIWNDDMSVLRNLCGSDVQGKTVTLRNDAGEVYELEISLELALRIRELSEIHTWSRNARWGVIKIHVEGRQPDSVFKVETRCNSSNKPYAYKDAYYAKIRKVVNEYVEYPVSPYQLFVSGIMYRIKEELKKYDMTLQYAFGQLHKSADTLRIISSELKRCHYTISVENFSQIVAGHTEMFE